MASLIPILGYKTCVALGGRENVREGQEFEQKKSPLLL